MTFNFSEKISLVKMMCTSGQTYNFGTLKVMKPREYVVQVEINRPEKRNAQNLTFYK